MRNIDPRVIFYVLIGIATLLEVAGDIVLKDWSIRNRLYLLLIGLGVYFVGIFFWAFSLRYEYMSKAVSYIVILNMIIVVLIGVFVYKEQLSLVNKIGIGLGTVSLVLVALK